MTNVCHHSPLPRLLPKRSWMRRTGRRKRRQQRQRPRLLLLTSEWSCGLNCLGQLLFCCPKILKWIGEWRHLAHRTHAESSLDFPKLHGKARRYLGSLWTFRICSEGENRLYCSSLDCWLPKKHETERQIDIKPFLLFFHSCPMGSTLWVRLQILMFRSTPWSQFPLQCSSFPTQVVAKTQGLSRAGGTKGPCDFRETCLSMLHR